MEFKAAICPNCGGELKLPDDKKVLKCMYCGKDIVVEEAINKAQPSLENYLILARTAKAAKNYKEAHDYYNKVLEIDESNYESWLGKAESAGWQGTVQDPNVQELITNLEKAISHCLPERKDAVIREGTLMANAVLVGFYNLISKYMHDSGLLQEVRETYYNRCNLLVSAWEILNNYNPTNKVIIDNIIFVCQQQIEGVEYNASPPGDRTLFRCYSDVKPQYKSQLTSIVSKYIAKGKALDPRYIPPEVAKKKLFNW
jgi:tetratricopeptide (TPR) repeat protein